MLTEAKRTLRVMLLSIKYNFMKAMINKTTFVTSILFMILNDASFIVQWIVIFSIKEDIAGFTFNDVMLLWAIAAGTFGVAHTFFGAAFEINELITDGKLDPYLVQPKDVLLMVITSKVRVETIGDILYGLGIVIFIYKSLTQTLLYLILICLGGITMVAFGILINSISFYIPRSEAFVTALSNLLVNTATYPGEIFSKEIQFVLYTIVPTGLYCYMPHKMLLSFDMKYLIIIVSCTVLYTILAYVVFRRGLRRYSSNNLMNTRA